jgi:hypothetical protein
MTTSNDAADAMRRTIQEGYSAIARVGGWSTDAIEAAGIIPTDNGAALDFMLRHFASVG